MDPSIYGVETGGYLYATQARISCNSPTMNDNNPNNAARKSPMMATVRAFLSVVCLSSQPMTAFSGGGFLTTSRSTESRSPQKSNAISGGAGRTNSIHLPSGSKPCFWIIVSRTARDRLSRTLATGNRISWKVNSVSMRRRGGKVPLRFSLC